MITVDRVSDMQKSWSGAFHRSNAVGKDVDVYLV